MKPMRNRIRTAQLLHIALAIVATAHAESRSENFAVDPHWEGVNNRIEVGIPPRIAQRFGWRGDTNFAGKAPGEIGGYIQSSTRPAHYAEVLSSTLTVEQPLSFSGRFALVEGRSLSGWHTLCETMVGFFNDAEQGWRAKNFLGFRFIGSNEPDGCTIEVYFGPSNGAAGGQFLYKDGKFAPGKVRDHDGTMLFRIPPDAKQHPWSFDYDPAGADGAGAIRFEVDGTVWTINLLPEHRQAGATFNRFGLFNQQLPGRAMVVYFDDIVINGKAYDFTDDPNWEGKGNQDVFEDPVQYGSQDFGYCPDTNYAGGEKGEVGGRIWRIEEPKFFGYYGADTGTLSLNDVIEARGKIAIRRFGIDSGVQLGFFLNTPEQEYPPRNFIGVIMDSWTQGGRFLMPEYGTSKRGQALDARQSLWFIDDGKPHDWTIRYDPAAGDGRGAVTVTLDDKRATIALPEGARVEGATMNRFGLFGMQHGNGKFAEIYLDDVTYTVKP